MLKEMRGEGGGDLKGEEVGGPTDPAYRDQCSSHVISHFFVLEVCCCSDHALSCKFEFPCQAHLKKWMDVITAGTTQSQQAAGKTNHTPEDVSDLRQNFTKKAATFCSLIKSLLGKGLMKNQLAGMRESCRTLYLCQPTKICHMVAVFIRDYFQWFSKPSCVV